MRHFFISSSSSSSSCCCGPFCDMMLIAIACQFPFRPENFPHHILNSPGIRNFLTCLLGRNDLPRPSPRRSQEFPTQLRSPTTDRPSVRMIGLPHLTILWVPHTWTCLALECSRQGTLPTTCRKRRRLRYLSRLICSFLSGEIKLKFLSVIFVNKTYDYCVTSWWSVQGGGGSYGTLLDFRPSEATGCNFPLPDVLVSCGAECGERISSVSRSVVDPLAMSGRLVCDRCPSFLSGR